MVREDDVRLVGLLRDLHELRTRMPKNPAPAPEAFVNAVASETDPSFLLEGRYLPEAADPDTDLGIFRSEKDQYSNQVISSLDRLANLLEAPSSRSNQIKNAWWHVWDDPPNPKFQDKMIRNVEYIIETAVWSAEDWINHVHHELSTSGVLPDSLESNAQFKVRIAQIGILQNAVQSKRDQLLRGLDAMDWKSYVRVKAQNSSEYADDELHQYLLSYNVVEINGVGGLGKTELLYQFLRRHLAGDYGNYLPNFQDYIILTAKSDEQGEIDTIRSNQGGEGLVTSSPRDARKGPRSFIKDLRFDDVIRVINTFDPECEDLLSVSNARRLLREGSFLLALDNFEDCREEDRNKFREFFKHPDIARSLNSRIVVTGRDKAFSVNQILLQILPPRKAQELFKKRYDYLYKIGSTKKFDIDWNGLQRVLNGFNDPTFPQNFEAMCASEGFEKFTHWMGHPLFIFHMTTLLGKNELVEKHQPIEGFDLIQLLRSFVADEDLELNKMHADLHAWIIGKAFRDVEQDAVALLILKLLMEHNSLTEDDLFNTIRTLHESPNLLLDFQNAIQRLVKHELFLRQSNIVEENIKAWQLKSDGHRFLSNQESLFALEPESQMDHERSESENEIQTILNEIDAKIFNDDTRACELIEQLSATLIKVPIKNKKNISIRTIHQINKISAKIRNSNDYERWGVIHNQAVDALMNSLLTNKLLDGTNRPQTLNLFTQLLVDSDFTSLDRFWALLNEPEAIHWINPEVYKNGRSELFRHKLMRLLQTERDSLEDWLNWGAYFQLICSHLRISNEQWRHIRTRLLSELELLRTTIAESRGTDLQFRLQHVGGFIQAGSMLDEQWEDESFQLLGIFDTYPTETSWDNISTWARYTIPPKVPEEQKLLPVDWAPPTGLSFDFYVAPDQPVFQLVRDYSTYRDDVLGGVMDDSNHLVIESIQVDESKLQEIESVALNWMISETQSNPGKALNLHKLGAEVLSSCVSNTFGWDLGVNKFLRHHSSGRFPSLKVWVINHLIMQDEFLGQFEYNEHPPLGSVTRRGAIAPKVHLQNSTPDSELQKIFTDHCPQFPDVTTTMQIIQHFESWIQENRYLKQDSVQTGKEFCTFLRKMNLKRPEEQTMAFGLGFHLGKREIITINAVLDAIKRNGMHRLEEKNKSHAARTNELRVLLEDYMVDLRKNIEHLMIKIDRSPRAASTAGTHRGNVRNPFSSEPRVQSAGRREQTQSAPSPTPNFQPPQVALPAPWDALLANWVERCLSMLPDADTDKHLRIAARKVGLKIYSSEQLLTTHATVLTRESVYAFEELIERAADVFRSQGAQAPGIPSFDEAFELLTQPRR